jgi:hypothetical protein
VNEGEPLVSDGVTQGIVRIGDTVRRPLRPFSLTVQAYLAHLRDAGFTGAPLPLGIDEQGREVLSFVPGDVLRHRPPETAGDDVLVAGNVVFRDGLPAALIDFDLAHPTTRVYDLANALWFWAPLRDPRDRAPAFVGADVPHRAAVFADAYGMTAGQRAGLAPMAVDIARRYHEDSRVSAELDPVWRKIWEDGANIFLPRAEAWVREIAPAITARLTGPVSPSL